MTDTPILPGHIEDTIRAITRLQAEHREAAGPLQRSIDRLTAWIARPQSLAVLSSAIVLWVAVNASLAALGMTPWDRPPFPWLQVALSLAALYVTIVILTTQRLDDQLAGYREQLTLELAILGEQKSAKIIALLEEMRRDSPHLADRADREAAALSVAAEPHMVLNAIKEAEQNT